MIMDRNYLPQNEIICLIKRQNEADKCEIRRNIGWICEKNEDFIWRLSQNELYLQRHYDTVSPQVVIV